jgi:Ca-activated chloride channel family protein
VILATDGDFNVGVKTEEELDQLITQHRESDIYLTCLGVGMGNLKDSKIHTLAQKGNGNYAYIDSYTEAEKVLLKEFTQTLYTVADRVFMNINFNSEFVKEYRLIGFDNKAGEIADTLTSIEGGEIGSGFSMTAVFEVVPSEENLEAIEKGFVQDKLCNLDIEYSLPGDTIRKNFLNTCPFSYSLFNETDKCQRFSTAVVMFGSKLRNSPYTKNADWNDILSVANASADMSDAQQKEFISLVEKAKYIYTREKKKKRKSKTEDE